VTAEVTLAVAAGIIARRLKVVIPADHLFFSGVGKETIFYSWAAGSRSSYDVTLETLREFHKAGVRVLVVPPLLSNSINALLQQHPGELAGLTCPLLQNNMLSSILQLFINFPPQV
jgi:hypothetical protein